MGKVLGGKQPQFPPWFKESFLEIAADVEEAGEEGKHVMLFFHVANCPYCYKMLEENFKASTYTNFLQEKFDAIEINLRGDREVVFNEVLTVPEKELARHLGVLYTPTILFLDPNNKVVLRLNGYRSVSAFKYVLDFVDQRAYTRTNLSQYIEDSSKKSVYEFRDHDSFSSLKELHAAGGKPLALLFEDRSCDECDTLHDGILSLPETKALLEKLTVIRLDAFSDEPIIGIDGNPTTPMALAAALGITYRPGILLFDKGKEVLRIDGMLRSFHFQQALRYVADRHHLKYPQFRDYRRLNTREIRESGRDIHIWK